MVPAGVTGLGAKSQQPGASVQDLAQCLIGSASRTPWPNAGIEYPVALPHR